MAAEPFRLFGALSESQGGLRLGVRCSLGGAILESAGFH